MIATQPNEARCSCTWEKHTLELPPCCPVTKNPQPSSYIEISYAPLSLILEVASLRAYIDSYQGGRGDVRSMESMIQQIAQDCADTIKQTVRVLAHLIIEPRQKMMLDCTAYPKESA
jgi:NADPH-dependent 7-cyano-7-deazaguanine reductase QueF